LTEKNIPRVYCRFKKIREKSAATPGNTVRTPIFMRKKLNKSNVISVQMTINPAAGIRFLELPAV
jgi:hypothetical protein